MNVTIEKRGNAIKKAIHEIAKNAFKPTKETVDKIIVHPGLLEALRRGNNGNT